MNATDMKVLIGHFEQPFLKDLDKKYLEGLKDRLLREIKDEPYARRHAVMNLLGFVCCELGDITEGMDYFRKVQKEDEFGKNLNAIKNFQWANSKLGLKGVAEETAAQLKEIMLQKDAKDLDVLKARAQIEIARAACLTDQHHKQSEDIQFAMRIFERALALGADNPDRNELMDWKFGFAFHLYRMAKKEKNDSDGGDQYFKLGVQQFYDVAIFSQSVVGSRRLDRQVSVESASSESSMHVASPDVRAEQRIKDLQGKAWAFAGVLLIMFKKRYNRLSAVVTNCNPEHAAFDGFKCLEKAKKVAPRCAAVLRRVAQTFCENGHLEQAKAIADIAIDVQPIGFAFYVRGQVYMKWHQRLIQTGEKGDKATHLLDLALKDLLEANKKNFQPSYAVRDIAVTYRAKEDLGRALDYFRRAEEATGGKKDRKMYEEWAKCLDDAGENAGAEEKRQCARSIR